MIAPRYVQEGLRLIDELYFAVFNSCVRGGMSNKKGRWQVRKWVGNRPLRFDLWDCHGYSDVIMTICKEAVTEDSGLMDVGYEEIDMRVVTAIRKANYWKNQWKKKIAEMDWRNEKRTRQANAELDYQSKYVAGRAWHMEREPTVHLGGKEWRV